MKRHFITLSVLAFFIIFFSCNPTNKLLREKLQSFEGQEDITVVLLGNSLSGIRWLADTRSSYGNYLKQQLGDLLESRISIINSSLSDDTFNSARKRVQVDILSFRPDIVFLMLGIIDSNLTGVSKTTYREHVKALFGILQKHDMLVIVLTAHGFRYFKPGYDRRFERLKEFNEITIWEAGLHRFPVIDVGEYMDRLRINSTEEYPSMFSNEFLLNEKGQNYIIAYVVKRIRKALKKER